MELVLVEWLDSRRGEGWARLEEVRDESPTRCRSVGWIIRKSPSALTIAGHLGENPEQCCGDMTIPKRSITKIRKLSYS